MHDLYLRSRLACVNNHPRLRKLWRTRDAWIAQGNLVGTLVPGIPPGAIYRQSTGRCYAPYWTTRRGLYPQWNVNTCYIYGIVNIRTGMTYVGRTKRSPYLRFQEHVDSTDFIGRAIRSQFENFVLVVLEKLPVKCYGIHNVNGDPERHCRIRENSWIHRLDTVVRGYNSRVELMAPPRPFLPSYGFGARPIRRSRQSKRITRAPALKSSRRFLSRDWKRRWDYLTDLATSRGYQAKIKRYLNKLKLKTVRCMLRYIGQQAISPEQREPFKRLRLRYLNMFPEPSMPVKTPPRLLILGFTSAVANVVPLRGILMRQNLLSLMPLSARQIRDSIIKTVPGFKYGETTDRMLLNSTNVGREVGRDCECICGDDHWSQYSVELKDKTFCVVTTDTSCLRSKNAEEVLKLQAGFRFEYAQQTVNKDGEEMDTTFLDDIEYALKEYVVALCNEFGVHFLEISEWYGAVMEEIAKALQFAYDGPDYLPLTGHIDFEEARSSLKNLQNQVVISRVDKAANCLSVMCKACYIRIAEAEVNGEGYEKMVGGTFEEIKETIILRQLAFLKEENLPAPTELKTNPLTQKRRRRKTHKQPTRYLMPKLHKDKIAFRSITTCCATTTEGVQRMVHSCLKGMLPTLHTLWREAGTGIGIISDGCWISQGGEEILDIVKEADSSAQSAGDYRHHRFETYDFVGMYPNIPLSVLLEKMRKLIDLVFEYQRTNYGYKSIFIEYGFKHNSPFIKDDGIHWSNVEPVQVGAESGQNRSYFIDEDRLFKWTEFVLKEGYVQFGANMYRQSSGIFMGSSPAPDLANYFAFMHEYEFYLEMIEEYSLARDAEDDEGPLARDVEDEVDSMYPIEFIRQYGARTKRYIDDIITVPLATQQGGLSFGDIIFKGTKVFIGRKGLAMETMSGMYDRMIMDLDEKLVPTTIAVTREQMGTSVHFLDMMLVQDGNSGTHVKMYDKRDEMTSLRSYRRYPHIETKLSHRSLYSVLHSQMCRFATRCTRIEYFEIAVAKLMTDMIDNHYVEQFLSSKLHNFSKAFIRKSPVYVRKSQIPGVRVNFWYNIEREVWRRIRDRDFDCK